MSPEIDERTRRARLAANGLTDPSASSPEAVVRRLLAVQAQDGRGFRLAVRSRSTGLTSGDVDRALTERRTLVVDWLNRGTLHLVAAEDHGWLHALTAPRLRTAVARRLQQEGVSPADAEDGVNVVLDAVRSAGPLTRDQLRQRLHRAGIAAAGQGLVYILVKASIDGHIVHGPMVGGQQAFADAISWLGARELLPRDEALARLARRYLAGHGPAGPGDLAAWSGLPLGDSRRAFAAIEAEAVVSPGGLLALADAAGAHDLPAPAPRLLGPFDPILHGWTSRRFLVGEGHDRVVAANGVFRPTALVDGQVVATWRLDRGAVELRPFEAIPASAAAALEADRRDVIRFLGLVPRRERARSPA